MPAKVKKGFSVTILTALSVSIILAILGWSGNGTLKAYSTAIDVNYVKAQMDTMNQSLSESLVYFHETSQRVEANILRLEYCRDKVGECKIHNENIRKSFDDLRSDLKDAQTVLILHRQRLRRLEKKAKP